MTKSYAIFDFEEVELHHFIDNTGAPEKEVVLKFLANHRATLFGESLDTYESTVRAVTDTKTVGEIELELGQIDLRLSVIDVK